jgi:hypothetical protein
VAEARANAGVHGHLLIELPDGRAMLATGRLPVNLARCVDRIVAIVAMGRVLMVGGDSEVLARVLGVPQKTDWKACAGTKADEEAEAAAFRKDFAPFDFTADL